MKFAVVLLCLALVAATSGLRFNNRRFLRRPVGGGTGFAEAQSTQGQSSNFFGNSAIQQSRATAGVSVAAALHYNQL